MRPSQPLSHRNYFIECFGCAQCNLATAQVQHPPVQGQQRVLSSINICGRARRNGREPSTWQAAFSQRAAICSHGSDVGNSRSVSYSSANPQFLGHDHSRRLFLDALAVVFRRSCIGKSTEFNHTLFIHCGASYGLA